MPVFPLSSRLDPSIVLALSLVLGAEVTSAQDAAPTESTPENAPPPSASDTPADPPETPPESTSEEAEPAEPEPTRLVPRPAESPEAPPTEAPPPSEDTDAADDQDARPEQPKSSEAALKARLDTPRGTAPAPPHLPPSALKPEAAHIIELQAERTEAMPGNYVARPVTLPRGTFRMEFGQGLVLWDAPAESALSPAFGLGITERVEIGVDAPLHHDPGMDEWVALHPRPHVAITWVDEEEYEIGTRLRVLIPGRPSMQPSAAVAVPVLWRASPEGRVDVVPELHVGVGSQEAIVARLSAKGTWQISPGMFAGIGGTAHVGLVDSEDTGFDPELTFGLTHQNYGRTFVDFVTHGFVKSLGGGEPGHVSRGAGFGLSLVFYPELY